MRHRISLVLTVAVLVVLTAGCDWSMFRYGPAHTGYNPFEHTIGTANVGQLTTRWQITTGNIVYAPPAVANGVVYIGSTDDKLYAFDATGSRGCAGPVTSCIPLWSASIADFNSTNTAPAIANGVLYVGSGDGEFDAFDAAGNTNCSGAPRTCTPLWSATIGTADTSSATIANGVVYVGSSDGRLYAFDAAGKTNCSGTPKSCAPLWTASTGDFVSSPAVANGVVYVGSDRKLYAFDAAGNVDCSGTPKACTPLWSATMAFGIFSSPAVANGIVYIG